MAEIISNIISKIICLQDVKLPFQKLDEPQFYDIRNAINVYIPIETKKQKSTIDLPNNCCKQLHN